MEEVKTPVKTHKRLTYRQRKLRAELVANGGKMGEAMRKAGYSPAYASNPAKLTSGQRWLQLMEKDIPDSLLSKTAKEGLKARKVIRSINGEKIRSEPDRELRHKYLETALKMKGKLIDRTDISSGGQQITGFTFIAPVSSQEARQDTDSKDTEQPEA